ncbi:hypothetical protein HAX54_020363 [Datura stramonium]|uniref:Reverse transcriptase domain-containing protein n=1 Tax=Datura stramonium TaxID=4076 RepID=A0ABS8S344_DATST|nr:hypothetical protein [Datura stramonium]
MTGPVITHFVYADDIVIFSGGNNKSIKLIKNQVRRYEEASGQKANKEKIFFITAPNTSASRINKMRKSVPIYTLSAMNPPPKGADSNAWRTLMKIKVKAEEYIIWKIQKGDSSFWWDNWTGKGALAKIVQGSGHQEP